MTDRADKDAAEAKMERVDELLADIDELNDEVDEKMATVDRLLTEAAELTEESGNE